MITFAKKRFAALRHVTVDNPLFFLQLRRLSIYTWLNLATLFALLLVIYCTVARSAHYWEAKGWIREFSESIYDELYLDQMHGGYQGSLSSSFSVFSRFSELAYLLGQLGGILPLYLILLVRSFQSLLFFTKSSWAHPFSPHIRLLPVSKSQALFALVDMRYFTTSICFLCCSFFLWLPTLDTTPELYIVGEIPLVTFFRMFSIGLWILVFAIYRTTQLQCPYGPKLWLNPLFFTWLIAILISAACPYFICDILIEHDNMTFIESMFVLIFFSTSVSCAILLISCWRKKGQLLNQLPPE